MSAPRSSRRARELYHRYTIPLVDGVLWCLAGAMLGTAIILSLSPAGARTGLIRDGMLLHTLGYFGLTLSWLLAAVWFPGRGGGALRDSPVAVTIGIIALSFLLEVSQGAVGRSVEAIDGLANVLGAGGALAAWSLLRMRFSNERASGQWVSGRDGGGARLSGSP